MGGVLFQMFKDVSVGMWRLVLQTYFFLAEHFFNYLVFGIRYLHVDNLKINS